MTNTADENWTDDAESIRVFEEFKDEMNSDWWGDEW